MNPARRNVDSSDLLSDPGVLADEPLLEVFGWSAVGERGGLAVLPRRDHWLDASASGVESVGLVERIGGETFRQGVVHLQKGKAATQEGLRGAWRVLDPGGRLLLAGPNELGIKSAVKRLSAELGQAPVVLANRAKGRVVGFEKTESTGPRPPDRPVFDVPWDGASLQFGSAAGVFSADRLDRGTKLLLECLPSGDAPRTIFDIGCGAGVLGLAALHRWTDAELVMADVDRRAVEAARANSERFGFGDRCRTLWWDATREAPPKGAFDLVLVNPPFHSGKAVDLDPARAMFRRVNEVLGPGGTALIVANRTLPYESHLGAVGRVRSLRDDAGFKVLSIER